ncbi:hypothetical protein B0H63DRAFT_518299 [Podospora didyma]|uniref:Protein kinase domain-containing protein n=1 Tax=Podospora didyma TaxID=330526 RepID=A0AAE0P8F7_9PEZI|nr:hypothetical protein B0H63DRAFT_518299 [Podospora didyma]
MRTLGNLIKQDADAFADMGGGSVALNHRLQCVYKLAEAVFFLHTAGFLHENITPGCGVVLPTPPSQRPTALVDGAYLMGFDLIRGADAYTAKQGIALAAGSSDSQSIWDFDVYQHRDRLQTGGRSGPRYIKTYDVYSLGVILLQVGLWQPLVEVVPELADMDKAEWADQLLELVPSLAPRVGERYAGLVSWCLGLTGDEVTRDDEFVKRVLDPLEDMAKALQA